MQTSASFTVAVTGLGASLVAVALLTVAAPETSARSRKVSPTEFAGTWKHVGSMKERRARRRAVDGVVQGLPVVMRGRARRRLAARTTPPRLLKFKATAKRIVLMDGSQKITLRFGAKPVQVKRNGNQGTVKARFKAGRLVVVMKGGGGKVVTKYKLSRDRKRLRLTIRLKARPLPTPLVYKATYRRK